MTYGPFVSFAPVGEGLLTASAGLRPLGPVLGVCAYGKVSDLGAPRYDGSGPPGPEGIYEACVATGLARLGDEARMRGAAFVGDLDFRFPVQLAVALEATGAFSAGGTAYAHPSRREPALTNLSGGEIARLLLAGWAPAGLCLGHAFWYQALGQRSTDLRASLGVFGRNVEHPDFTDALRAANALARARLEFDARACGGEGIVGLKSHTREIRVGAVAQIALIASATAIVRAESLETPMQPGLVLPL